jgi:predicted esterase
MKWLGNCMIILKKQTHLPWIAFLVILQGCFTPSRYFMRKNLFISNSQPIKAHSTATSPNKEPIITVWIHGTRLTFRPLFQKNNPPAHVLIKAHSLECDPKLKAIATTLICADSEQFQTDHFYLFNWSGKLCFEEREIAAKQLHYDLESLIQSYQKTGINPYIRIIGHSHGGNVALNLAHHKNSFQIDELILLACPVQEKTKFLITKPLFKSIYALYSAFDIIQILDPQGIYKHKNKTDPLFSNRQFAHQPNLAQMKVKIDRRAISHFEFAQPSFLKLLPEILKNIDEWHKNITYTENPNKTAKLLCVYTKKTNKKAAFTI